MPGSNANLDKVAEELMNIIQIDSLSLPELEPYRTMRRTLEHRAKGIFVAESEKVVRRLLESDLKVVSILLTRGWLNIYENLLENRQIGNGIFVGEKSLLEQIVGCGLHQGIMAIGRVPASVAIFDLLNKFPNPRLLVASDGIANSENMGVIVRNCAAFGVQALIAGETSCDPYLRRSVRNSMGTIFKLPIASAEKLSIVLKRLRDEFSFQIVAAHPQSGSKDIADADFSKDICIVFGGEGKGISEEILDECSIRVRIQMQNDVDSINVASSVGVVLYETIRQRGMGV